MKRILMLAMLALPLPTLADDLPKRAPGLWEHRMQMSQTGDFTHSVHVCTDGAMDQLAMQRGASECSKLAFTRDGERVLVESVCQAGGSTASTRGSFSGDFDKHIVGQLMTVFNPPLNGMRQSVMRIDARWLGPCKPGQKPGDVIVQGLPGGMNLNELMRQMPRMPGQ